jgi:sulfatase modifying factor 1
MFGLGAGGLLAGGAGLVAGRWLLAQPRLDTPRPMVRASSGMDAPRDMLWVPGGSFSMGSDHPLSQPNERPPHAVRVGPFWMDRTHVTNDQFAAFVRATGHVTSAERTPDWETLRVQLPPGAPRPPEHVMVPGAMVFAGTSAAVDLRNAGQWWRFVAGAHWKAPQGPGSSIDGKDDHPVVQVSHEDALAYAKWIGKRLPTEAEWEFAARGGMEQATYAWGDEMEPGGKPMANVWSPRRAESFPVVSAKAAGVVDTMPAGTYPANGYGLHDMTGNAWQWVADWYRSDAFHRASAFAPNERDHPFGPSASWDAPGSPQDAPKRVIRGGSFLCNVDYCMSFRPSARQGADPSSPMSHIGFRLVVSA